MILELSIRNFAIIDDLRISFSDGLTILSGETGAGKSIILQAVNLLLGSRASSSMIRTGAEAAEIEALFAIPPESRTATAMKSLGYDPSEGLLIRRIISQSDRHRIHINGRLATIQISSGITENLVSISGQHAHQGLLKEDQHLQILDQFSGLLGLRNDFHSCYNTILPLIQKFEHLKASAIRQSELMDLLAFQKREISEAGIKPEEDKNLEKERIRLKNSGMLYQIVTESIESLYSGDGAVSEKIFSLIRVFDKAKEVDTRLCSFSKTLAEAVYIIEDAAGGLRSYLNSIEMDETRLEEVEARLDFLHKLKRKYGGSLEAIISRQNEIEKELSEIENLSVSIEETQKELSLSHVRLCALAKKLSEGRIKSAVDLSRQIESELAYLHMPDTRFEIDLDTMPADSKIDMLSCEGNALTQYGMDRACFMIAPNPGEALKPLSQIASGGELSRVVLALKAILSKTDSVETIIFDEVDAGIGGGTAEAVGKKLLNLSLNCQVICITHLPQIARYGKHHFRISKEMKDGRSSTIIKPLTPEERIHELARMLGGQFLTSATWEHARELLESS